MQSVINANGDHADQFAIAYVLPPLELGWQVSPILYPASSSTLQFSFLFCPGHSQVEGLAYLRSSVRIDAGIHFDPRLIFIPLPNRNIKRSCTRNNNGRGK